MLSSKWNPDDFQQILSNLIDNASEAMEKPGDIRIQVKQVKSFVSISTVDEGVGIPKDRIN